MKKSSYRSRSPILQIKQHDAVDIETGEPLKFAAKVYTHQPDFGYFFLAGYEKFLTDERLTGSALKVFNMLFLHTAFDSNEVNGTTLWFCQRLRMSKQQWHPAIALLRAIGVVLPSQAKGKYHLNIEVVYRGHLTIRKRLLTKQGYRPV